MGDMYRFVERCFEDPPPLHQRSFLAAILPTE
jgi:hypothetical protein